MKTVNRNTTKTVKPTDTKEVEVPYAPSSSTALRVTRITLTKAPWDDKASEVVNDV